MDGLSPNPQMTRSTQSASFPTPQPALKPVPSKQPSHRSQALNPSLLQPRLAVVLNVPSPWHPWLFLCRLLSILPAIWWGLPTAWRVSIRLLANFHIMISADEVAKSKQDPASRGRMIETSLATIWCFASGYLSFFFTDCLMSRWLLNYTPQATIVRLLTINSINAYITSTVLAMTGGLVDSRLFLPGWISIATTLTICYHVTHQKINIRKETSTSINVFSFASYISMVTLLVHRLTYRNDYPAMPVVEHVQTWWHWIEETLTTAELTSPNLEL